MPYYRKLCLSVGCECGLMADPTTMGRGARVLRALLKKNAFSPCEHLYVSVDLLALGGNGHSIVSFYITRDDQVFVTATDVVNSAEVALVRSVARHVAGVRDRIQACRTSRVVLVCPFYLRDHAEMVESLRRGLNLAGIQYPMVMKYPMTDLDTSLGVEICPSVRRDAVEILRVVTTKRTISNYHDAPCVAFRYDEEAGAALSIGLVVGRAHHIMNRLVRYFKPPDQGQHQ
jgi:hypothetical protein